MGIQKTIHFYENVMSGIREKIGNIVSVAEGSSQGDFSPRLKLKNKIEQTWFYRTHSGEYRQVQKSPENVRLVLIDRERHAALCPVHGKWELCTARNGRLVFGCGMVNNGMLLDFSATALPRPEPRLEFDEVSGHDVDVPPSEEETELYRYKHWGEINSSVYDENGVSRDLAYVRVVENITLNQIHVELVFLDRIRAQNRKKCIPSKLFNTAIRFEFTFDIKQNNSVVRCLSGNMPHDKDKLVSSVETLPKNVADFIADRARSIIRRNWGSTLTLDYHDSGFAAVRAMMDFPFEPGLHDIKCAINGYDYRHCTERFDNNRRFNIGRFDMNGYNSLCDFLEIKSFGSLRKAYQQNPVSLLSYKGLSSCGFTDKNLIMKAIGEEVGKLFMWTSSFNLCFLNRFCHTVIRVRGEKPALTLISKNMRDAERIGRPELCRDTAMFFARILDHQVSLPETLFKDLMQNGLTKNNHDALMELDYMTTHKVVEFKYRKKELALEDEIDGYTFRLPKDSKQLYEIGQNLHNCVGGYQDRIFRRECLVVYAMKDGHYRLCIEVRDLRQVWQQRANFNSDPKGADAIVMQKWRSAHKLSFSGNSF